MQTARNYPSFLIAAILALAACGDPGSGTEGPDGGTTSDPRSGFVGAWHPKSLHHWTYTCNDGTSGGYDRAQTGFYWSLALGTGTRITLSIHDPMYPTCINGAGTCSHDYEVSGNVATAVPNGGGVTGTYTPSNEQLIESIAYSDSSTGPTCQWNESDTLIRGMP